MDDKKNASHKRKKTLAKGLMTIYGSLYDLIDETKEKAIRDELQDIADKLEKKVVGELVSLTN